MAKYKLNEYVFHDYGKPVSVMAKNVKEALTKLIKERGMVAEDVLFNPSVRLYSVNGVETDTPKGL